MGTRPSDSILEAAWNAADVPIVVSSVHGVVDANSAFTRLTGADPASLAGTPLAMLADGADRQKIDAAVTAVLDEGVNDRAQEVCLRAAGRGVISVDHVCRAVEMHGQRLAVSTFVASGDRNRLADAVAASEQRYRSLFEEDTAGRFVTTEDWRLIDCNDVFARALGYADRWPLIGRNLLEMTPDGPILQKLLAVARVEGRAGPVEFQIEREDGTLIDVSCLLASSLGEGDAIVSLRGQVVEITARKRLETRLQGAERMEVIGRLAGGLAHDFNNLLTVIRGNTERLLESMEDHDPLKGAVSAIDQAAVRAASMTRQLLAYGRRQVFELRPLSLQELIADLQPLLTEILGDHISVQVWLPSETPQISADARQIEHVLANLAVNAREAMPAGGTLTITVDAVDVAENGPRERVWLRPGRYVRLLVSDTGQGMDSVTRAYAFQPFFTTKRMGNGRGLGLATVYGIVKQSHGFVWVESEVGHGATFTLLFPAINSNAEGARAAGRSNAHETILVVEVDAAVRTFVGEALRRRGYHVLDAASGADAVEIFASHPSRIHLVLSDGNAVTDQGMPLVVGLQAIDPVVQSLVMLEPQDADDRGPRVLPTTPSIQRPFTLQALADKVREVLDSGEGRG